MIIAACLLAISAIFTAVPDWIAGSSVSSTMWSFNFFRVVGGVGVGLCSIASPMYIAELSPPEKRGRLGLMYQLAIVTGHAVAPAIAYVIVRVLRTSFGVEEGEIPQQAALQAWRWMFFSETVCVLAFVYFVFGLPLSPRWLAQKSRFDEAHSALAGIGGSDFADSELAQIKESLQEEQGSWSELFAPGMRFALLVGILLAFFNNWTGWSVIGGYIPRLFEAAGFGRESAIRDFAITILWTFIFSGAYLFPSLVKLSERLVGSAGGAFWLFTVICFLSLLFGWFVMPETKGRTLEEIAKSWKKT